MSLWVTLLLPAVRAHTHVQPHPGARPCVALATLPHPAPSCLNAGARAVHAAGEVLPHWPFGQ